MNTRLESLVVHADETTIHAHFMLRAYDEGGNPVSDTAKARVMAGLQDLAAEVMQRHHPKIERGRRKAERLAAGADYPEVLNRSVRQLHEDLPQEIAEREARLAALRAEARELDASMEKTSGYLEKLTAQSALNEKEEKRLRTYEERLLKKEAEMAAVEAALRGLVAGAGLRTQRAHRRRDAAGGGSDNGDAEGAAVGIQVTSVGWAGSSHSLQWVQGSAPRGRKTTKPVHDLSRI